jgi:hypothetical protein
MTDHMHHEDCAAQVRLTRRFNADPRTKAARRQYRAAIKAGTKERDAWTCANAIYEQVRRELSA